MYKIHFYIILFTLAAFNCKAANVVLEVSDKSNSQTLAGTKISYLLKGKIVQAITNERGYCLLKDVVFPISITLRAYGYETVVRDFSTRDLITRNDTTYIQVAMNKLSGTFNEVVVTAQAKPVLASQSIYKVNTINNAQIMQRGAISLNDVLSYEMNNFVSNDNVLGSAVSIAGIGGQNVKVLINGIPVLGRENGNIDLGQLNLNNVKRVEMIQGPMSVMYGSNAMGGVINLITENSKKSLDWNVRMYLESIGRYNLNTSFNLGKNRHSLQGSFARNFFQGWTPSNDTADRFQLWKPKIQYTSDLQYNYQLKRINFTYFGSLMSEKITNLGLPIINPFEGYAFDEYYRTRRIINSISTKILLNERSTLTFLNSYSNYYRTKNRFKKDLVTLNQIETTSIGDQDTSIFNNLNLRGTYQNSTIKNLEYTLGYEFSHDNAKSFKLSSDARAISDLGIFASALYGKNKFSFQPSARFTLNNQFGRAYTPALHAKWDLNSKIQIRTSYASGFRAPSLKEMYLQFIDQNHTIIGNELLKPETGHHVEIGVDNRTHVGKKNLTLSLNGSYNSIKNMITLAVFDGSGVLRKYANLDQYRNWLLNAKGRMNSKALALELGAGVIYVEQTSIIPQHSIYEASSNVSYFFTSMKTTLNFNYKFNSKQPILTVDEKYLFTRPIHIANASLQKYLFDNSVNLQLGVKNLFNLQSSTLSSVTNVQGGGHISTSGIQMFPERSVFVEMQYRFHKK